MIISIISDLHLEFGYGTEREEDVWEAGEEAFQKALDSDLILIPGDLFDTKIPRTETFVKAMQLLLKPLFKESKTKVVEGINKDINNPLLNHGIPVVAIHGTHERRIKGLLNPVQALEKAGFLIYLHCNGVIMEKEGEKICIQGMSTVPDQYAKTVLQEWNPKPIDGCYNILMLHQSLSPFMYAPYMLDIHDLPEGFDLYVCGHIHEARKSEYKGSPLIIAGSLVHTQLTKEVEVEKGFWKINTMLPKIWFVPLENQRRIYYEEFDTETFDRERIEKRIEEILKEEHRKKPVIKIKFKGKPSKIPFNELRKRFEDDVILVFSTEFEEERYITKNIEEQRLSVQELGKKILAEELEKSGLDVRTFEDIFEAMMEKKGEKAVKILEERIKGEGNG